jgi:hypothetical protein
LAAHTASILRLATNNNDEEKRNNRCTRVEAKVRIGRGEDLFFGTGAVVVKVSVIAVRALMGALSEIADADDRRTHDQVLL